MSDGPPGVEPLVAEPPSVDAARAAEIAEREFGTAGSVSELGGERDQNFRVDAGDDDVLKIRPPLAFERDHADRLLAALDAALSELPPE